GRRTWMGITSVVFAIIVLASDQRTATFAMLAGLIISLALAPRPYRTIFVAAGVATLIAASVLMAAAWSELGSKIADYLPDALLKIVSDESSFAWRVNYWQDYLDVYWRAPLIDQIIGHPLGVPIVAITEQRYLEYGAHSEYVQLLYVAGAL